MGIYGLATAAERRRIVNGEEQCEATTPRISMPRRIVAPLGASVGVSYAAPGADRVAYEPFDPWSTPRSVPEAGAFDALATAEPTYHRMSAWWGRTILRRTMAVEGWRRPFLLVEPDGHEVFETPILPTVSGFAVDLVYVQRDACAVAPPAFDELPMPRAPFGLILVARLRVLS